MNLIPAEEFRKQLQPGDVVRYYESEGRYEEKHGAVVMVKLIGPVVMSQYGPSTVPLTKELFWSHVIAVLVPVERG